MISYPESLKAIAEIIEKYRAASVDYEVPVADGGMANPSQASLDHYRRDGEQALDLILQAMLLTGKTSLGKILDMPSGYGRVARHLICAFPEAQITASDIDVSMLNFCKAKFGCKPWMSSKDLTQVHYPEKYDLIWSGSLFTHLPRRQFCECVDLFSRSLAPNGVAVLTTHGRFSSVFGRDRYLPAERFSRMEQPYKEDGFAYLDYRDEVSDITDAYGITLSHPRFLFEVLDRDPSLRTISFTERGWGGHQDVLVVQKKHLFDE